MKRMHTNQQIEEIAEEVAESHKLYKHSIHIHQTGDSPAYKYAVSFEIVTTGATSFTYVTLYAYMNEYYPSGTKLLPASGMLFKVENDAVSIVYGIAAPSGDRFSIYASKIDGSVMKNDVDFAKGLVEVVDTVIELA